jgi:hypothetical protein
MNKVSSAEVRADGAIRSVAERSAMEESRALVPTTAQARQGPSPEVMEFLYQAV